MEFILAYMWLLKIITALLIILVCYIAFWKNKFENKSWNIFASVLIILSFIK
jgi:hypothetical protein